MNGRRKRGAGDKSRDPLLDEMLAKRPHLWDLDDEPIGEPVTHAVNVGEGDPLVIEDLD
jgi:hypothetical protein